MKSMVLRWLLTLLELIILYFLSFCNRNSKKNPVLCVIYTGVFLCKLTILIFGDLSTVLNHGMCVVQEKFMYCAAYANEIELTCDL